jgi:adenylate cyclase
VIRWRLQPLGDGTPVPLAAGHPVVLGRGSMCDAQVSHDTVSRHHAELTAEPERVVVRDLGSANGTFVNGRRVRSTELRDGEEIRFGEIAFRLERQRPTPREPGEPLPAGTLVRAVDVTSGSGPLARLTAARLAALVELAGRLSGEITPERVLASVATLAVELLPADRAAVLLLEEGEGLRVAATHRGGAAALEVPGSIVWRAIDERAAVITDDAGADARFQSGSVVRQRIRSALAVPLLGDDGSVLGALYLDSLARSGGFADEEAALAFAFAGLAAVTLARARWAEAARRDAVARSRLERYFAPAVAARIAERRSAPRPGGERLPATVLFSDLRGFVGLAESSAPEAVAALLSEYFEAMVEIVFAQGGTLDKFIGDALLAVWGAPEPTPDDTARAVAAAIAMQRKTYELNTQWRSEGQGKPALAAGMGLHAGDVFAGMIGSARRLEYTVIGDVVNVASRLCDAAAPGEILVTTAVQAAVPPGIRVVRRGELALSGRAEPIPIWRVEES